MLSYLFDSLTLTSGDIGCLHVTRPGVTGGGATFASISVATFDISIEPTTSLADGDDGIDACCW